MENNQHKLRFLVSFVTFMIMLACIGENYVWAQSASKREFLFKIQRTRDADEVYFDVLLNEVGDLELSEPIVTYWVRHTRKGKVEPLKWPERVFAYGIKYVEKRPDFVSFYFVSNQNQVFHVRKNPTNQFRLYFFMDDVETKVTDIIVYFKMRFYGFPNIEKVEIYGISLETGENVISILFP